MVRSLAVLASLVAVACTGPDDEPVKVVGSGKVELIEGVPEAGSAAPRATVSLESTPEVVSTLSGVVAVGTSTGALVGSLGDEPLVDLKVHPDQDGPKHTGAIHMLAARDDGGLLVMADEGLFTDSAGYLLPSPLGTDIAPLGVTSLDSFGSGDDEEIWFTAGDGAHRIVHGKVGSFSVEGMDAPTRVVAVGPGQAVLVAGQVYFVDLGGNYALAMEADLGSVQGAAHGEDGTVYLATDRGLFSRTRKGKNTLRTFAAPGEPAVAIRAVGAAYGAAMAVTDSALVSLETTGPKSIGDAAKDASSVGVDANGDVWVAGADGLFHHKTGKAVSFATDVKPFFDAHCQKCHDVGASSAPDRDFTDYDIAHDLGADIVARLRATDATTMPPPNSEVLTASDYAVVTRWVAQGLLP